MTRVRNENRIEQNEKRDNKAIASQRHKTGKKRINLFERYFYLIELE
jgi:hypothetical protein